MAHIKSLLSRARNQNLFLLNFYRLHVLYFIFTILLSSLIVYGSGINGNSHDEEAKFKLRYIDALFLCTSAMTNTGLNTVNLSSITAFQQSVLFVLILIGNITVVSTVTVAVRRHWMRKYMRDFVQRHEGGRKMVENIEREERGERGNNGGIKADDSSTLRRRRMNREAKGSNPKISDKPSRPGHHETGHGGLPYPWEWSISRKLGSTFRSSGRPVEGYPHHYLSFKPSLDHKVGASLN